MKHMGSSGTLTFHVRPFLNLFNDINQKMFLQGLLNNFLDVDFPVIQKFTPSLQRTIYDTFIRVYIRRLISSDEI